MEMNENVLLGDKGISRAYQETPPKYGGREIEINRIYRTSFQQSKALFHRFRRVIHRIRTNQMSDYVRHAGRSLALILNNVKR